jgi:transcriptional regulator NrdR family protein
MMAKRITMERAGMRRRVVITPEGSANAYKKIRMNDVIRAAGVKWKVTKIETTMIVARIRLQLAGIKK